jgi:phosphate transport system substrate-binding protein
MKNFSLCVIICISFFACQNYAYDGPGQDVPTAGSIEIYVDRSDSLLLVEWIELFQMNYPKAKVKPIFASHQQIMKWLEVDSLKKAFILNKKLSNEQKEHLAAHRNCTVHETPLAKTSLVFISDKQSNIQEINNNDLVSHFSDVAKPLSYFKEIVCDSLGIQIDQLKYYIISKTKRKFQLNGIKLVQFKSDQEIIDYVQKHKNSLGLISLNSIGNNYNKRAVENQSKVRILKVQSNEDSPHFPFQSQIKANQYLFIQDIVAYDLQGYSGLANGFITYVNSQPGQIICKKNGLIPSNDVGRTIEIDTK